MSLIPTNVDNEFIITRDQIKTIEEITKNERIGEILRSRSATPIPKTTEEWGKLLEKRNQEHETHIRNMVLDEIYELAAFRQDRLQDPLIKPEYQREMKQAIFELGMIISKIESLRGNE